MNPPAPRRTTPPVTHWQPSDLRAAGRLVTQATLGLTDLVENLHHTILRRPGPLGRAAQGPAPGITGLVYRSIRGVTRLVGGGLDALAGPVEAWLGPGAAPPSRQREAVVAALNGVLGDHLQPRGNPLAIAMTLQHEGRPLDMQAPGFDARPKVLLQIHGLCMSPGQWTRRGRDPGAALADAGGFTRLHLHYNTGLPIAENGRLLADRLQALQQQWPVPLQALVIVAHSMGGLVARSACQQAAQRGDRWPGLLQRMVFLGTPQRGAPLERGGHLVDRLLGTSPYSAAFARLGRLRSAGITGLRHGEPLGRDGAPLPLPAGVDCLAVAGSLARRPRPMHEAVLGDGLVPLDSALALGQPFVARGVGHLELMDDPRVWQQVQRWVLS